MSIWNSFLLLTLTLQRRRRHVWDDDDRFTSLTWCQPCSRSPPTTSSGPLSTGHGPRGSSWRSRCSTSRSHTRWHRPRRSRGLSGLRKMVFWWQTEWVLSAMPLTNGSTSDERARLQWHLKEIKFRKSQFFSKGPSLNDVTTIIREGFWDDKALVHKSVRRGRYQKYQKY